jgi:ParB family chromosome partitioning protein
MQRRRPTLQHIAIDLLVRGKYQPRQHFDPDKLQELADSIKATSGLLQPIVVRPLATGTYEIVAGERRWRAAQLAGLDDVSCLVTNYSDEQTLQASIVENTSRADLNPIEEAQAYQRLIDEFGYLHDEVAASVGKSRAGITNTLRMLKLEQRVQKMLVDGRISEGHGKILAGLEPALQVELAERCVQKNWNVRKLELEVKKAQQSEKQPGGKFSDANVQRLEIALSEHLGNRVQVDYEERGGGYMRIRFNNVDELEGHFDKIGFEFE